MKNKYIFYTIAIIMLLMTIKFSLGALTDNLLVYYNFDNSSTVGSTLVDKVNRQNGTIQTGVSTGSLGYIGDSYTFHGGNGVNLSTNPIFDNQNHAGGFTVSVWVFTNGTATTHNNNVLFSTATDDDGIGLILRRTSGGVAGNEIDLQKATVIDQAVAYVLTNTAWHHIVMVGNFLANGSAKNVSLYVNGTFIGAYTGTSATSPYNLGTGKWKMLGFSNGGSTAKFTGGKMDEFGYWNRSLSESEISTLFNYYTSGVSYPFLDSNNTITFTKNSQVPNDITTTNLFNEHYVNITYTLTNHIHNNTYPILNYTVANGQYFINGSTYNIYPKNSSYSYNTSNSTYVFSVDGDNLYPATYPAYFIEELEDVDHYFYALSNNHYLNLSLKNVRNETPYGIFELMLNTSLGTAEIRYCNSSYTGGNPISNNNCFLFATFSGTGFNHTHGKSKHNTYSFPLNITSGRIGTVYVTNQSYFLVRGTSVNQTFVGYTQNVTNIASVSTDSGATYTALPYTFDYHLHQYSGNETFRYNVCGLNTSNSVVCDTTFYTDNLDLTVLPPTTPQITNPNTDYQVVKQYLNITYVASIGTGANITFYNITLLNSDLSFNRTIKSNNSLNLSYYWNTYADNLSTGIYYINVTVKDTAGGLATFTSTPFNITRNAFINVTAKNVSTYIYNFTVFIVNRNTSEVENQTINSNTSYFALFDIVKGYNYTINISSNGFANARINFSTNISYNNYTFALVPTNSISLYFYEELTKSLLLENVTFLIYSDDYEYNSSTGVGYLFASNLVEGSYIMRYYADNFNERAYYVDISNGSTQTFYLYLINNTNSQIVTVTLRDNFGNLLTGADISLLRYYPQTNTYETVEIIRTDNNGKGYFKIQVASNDNNGEFFKFIINVNDVTVLETVPNKIFDTNINFVVYLTSPTLTEFYDLQDVVYNLTFNSLTNNYRLTYTKTDNNILRSCLYVYDTSNFGKTLYNSSCVNSTSATILLSVLNQTGKSYMAYFYGNDNYIDSLAKDFKNNIVTMGKTGLFLAIFFIMAMALIGIYNPTISIVLTVFGLSIMTMTGLITLGYSALIGIITITGIIIYLNKS